MDKKELYHLAELARIELAEPETEKLLASGKLNYEQEKIVRYDLERRQHILEQGNNSIHRRGRNPNVRVLLAALRRICVV